MNRRRFLAATTTGAVGITAGCSYLHGAGDLRDRHRIVDRRALFESRHVSLDDGRIVIAQSGEQWVEAKAKAEAEDSGDGDRTRAVVTTITVADRSGEVRTSTVHRERSTAVAAVGQRIYLLDEADALVAFDVATAETDGAVLEEGWRVELEDPTAPIVADRSGVYVSRPNGIVAVRRGEVTWTVSLPDDVHSLHVADGIVIVSTGRATVAIDGDGDERWRLASEGPTAVASRDGLSAVLGLGGLLDPAGTSRKADNESTADEVDGNSTNTTEDELSRDDARSDDADTDDGMPNGGYFGDLILIDHETGVRQWSATTGGSMEEPTITADSVYVVHRNGVTCFDRDSGEECWSVSVDAEAPLVAGPNGRIHSVSSRWGECTVFSLDEEGVRWHYPFDRSPCSVLAGWIDDDMVAFLFEPAELVRFQRVDREPPGLL